MTIARPAPPAKPPSHIPQARPDRDLTDAAGAHHVSTRHVGPAQGHDRGSAIPGSTAENPRKPSNAGCPTLHVELYRHRARLHGAHVLALPDLAGVHARQYDQALGCWTVPANRVDDVICAAEYRQRRFVTVAEVDR